MLIASPLLCLSLTHELLRIHGSTPRRQKGLEKAVSFVHVNTDRAVSAARLARIACLSPRSLQLGFRESFGMGPMAYAKHLRLARAHEEIGCSHGPRAPIAEVARRWGFGSASTFIRLYRQQFGELPSETARSSRFSD
jgi:transcriptional regulator GlxA family with amidase domain